MGGKCRKILGKYVNLGKNFEKKCTGNVHGGVRNANLGEKKKNLKIGLKNLHKMLRTVFKLVKMYIWVNYRDNVKGKCKLGR